jgi:hypothetical protein
MLLISSLCTVDSIIIAEGNKFEVMLSIPTIEGGMALTGTFWADGENIQGPVMNETAMVEGELDPPKSGNIGVIRNVSCFYKPVDNQNQELSMNITDAPSARISLAGSVASKEDNCVRLNWNCYSAPEGAHVKSAEFVPAIHPKSRMKAIEKGRLIHATGYIVNPETFTFSHYQLLQTITANTPSPNKRKNYFENRKNRVSETAERLAVNSGKLSQLQTHQRTQTLQSELRGK